MKTALITGISGQGGSYLAKSLLENGYHVVGTARTVNAGGAQNLVELGIIDRVVLRAIDLQNDQQVVDLIDQLRPDEIYHLAAPSSVARSFIEPADTIYSIALTTVNVLEAIRKIDKNIPCFIASSTEVFGNCKKKATEKTAHNPQSPYGIGKSCAQQQTRIYREAYGLFACTGILSNFESQLRPRNYVTSKIVNTACEIALGNADTIELGNVGITRDWGAAEDFMNAARLTLQQDQPDDYIIATGTSHRLKDFLDITFSRVGLRYQDHLVSKKFLTRPLDINQTLCDTNHTESKLDWSATRDLNAVVTEMLYAELSRSTNIEKACDILGFNTQKPPKNVVNINSKA
ncbi:GDP-mannose 4,6-dehydratase [Arenicella sp. 4NH20-0111]|uniref:GDP-mannose 4,6-dehydratase n=1 Tax=Arenicella sp. 4NH20-0111 TaxID=3127648 RepID=UPI00310249B5